MKKGDNVICKEYADMQFTKGKIYTVKDCSNDIVFVELDDRGSTTNGWDKSKFDTVSTTHFFETPELKDKDSSERKGEPMYSGVLRYFPDALAAVSRVSKAGNDKHNPGEPLHWSRGKSNDHLDCLTRHIITPDEIDPESGQFHLAHAAWRVLAALQLLEEKRMSEQGIKTFSGETHE